MSESKLGSIKASEYLLNSVPWIYRSGGETIIPSLIDVLINLTANANELNLLVDSNVTSEDFNKLTGLDGFGENIDKKIICFGTFMGSGNTYYWVIPYDCKITKMYYRTNDSSDSDPVDTTTYQFRDDSGANMLGSNQVFTLEYGKTYELTPTGNNVFEAGDYLGMVSQSFTGISGGPAGIWTMLAEIEE